MIVGTRSSDTQPPQQENRRPTPDHATTLSKTIPPLPDDRLFCKFPSLCEKEAEVVIPLPGTALRAAEHGLPKGPDKIPWSRGQNTRTKKAVGRPMPRTASALSAKAEPRGTPRLHRRPAPENPEGHFPRQSRTWPDPLEHRRMNRSPAAARTARSRRPDPQTETRDSRAQQLHR